MSSAQTFREHRRFSRCPVGCRIVRRKIEYLSDYLDTLSGLLPSNQTPYWFRGQRDTSWELTPSALRFSTKQIRDAALGLLSAFKRIAEIKLPRPPLPDEELKWLQVAQHYGLPTRLLDWTENALFALYFACEGPKTNALVFVLNPVLLNRNTFAGDVGIFDEQSDANRIAPYLKLDGRQRSSGRATIAVSPVWNSERIVLQRGAFTLHGQRLALTGLEAPGLAAIPILKETKASLLLQLEAIGVDEMTMFPELEHASKHLRRHLK